MNSDITGLRVDGFAKDQSEVRVDGHVGRVVGRGGGQEGRCTRVGGGEVQTGGACDTGVGVAGKVLERGDGNGDVVVGFGAQVDRRVDGDRGGAGSGDLVAGDRDGFDGETTVAVVDGDVAGGGVDGFVEGEGQVGVGGHPGGVICRGGGHQLWGGGIR